VGKTTMGDNTPETEEQRIYNSGKETVWESSLPKKKPQSKSCGGAVSKFKNRKK